MRGEQGNKTALPCSQTSEGPEQEGGQSEAQPAGGEEEERPVTGRRPQARGQPDRQLTAAAGGFIHRPHAERLAQDCRSSVCQ